MWPCAPVLVTISNLLICELFTHSFGKNNHIRNTNNCYTSAELYTNSAIKSSGVELHTNHCTDGCRFRKNTHITNISNSVTHLWSFTNTAISEIIGNATLSTDIAAPSSAIAALMVVVIGSSSDWCFMSVSWCLARFYDIGSCLMNNKHCIAWAPLNNWFSTTAKRLVWDDAADSAEDSVEPDMVSSF